MGRTHYWYRKPTLDPKHYTKWVQDVSRILRSPGVLDVIGNPHSDDHSLPQVTPDLVAFNGLGDQAYESFYLAQEEIPRTGEKDVFGCTKIGFITYAQSYSAIICACLIAAKERFGDAIRVESDGDWGNEEWTGGAAIYKHATGKEATNPMRDDPDPVPIRGVRPL